MTVAHVRDIVDAIEIGLSVFIVQVMHESARDLQRLPVGQAQRRIERRAPTSYELGAPGLFRRLQREGQAQDAVGVGRKRCPKLALARRADAGEIVGVAQQVYDDLKMQMRRPIAVSRIVADMRQQVARFDALPDLPALKRPRRQMRVERVEAEIGAGLVLENQRWTVALRAVMIGKTVNPARERREDRRLRRREEIDAQMQRPALMLANGECVCEINRARLIVEADAKLALAQMAAQRLGVSG